MQKAHNLGGIGIDFPHEPTEKQRITTTQFKVTLNYINTNKKHVSLRSNKTKSTLGKEKSPRSLLIRGLPLSNCNGSFKSSRKPMLKPRPQLHFFPLLSFINLLIPNSPVVRKNNHMPQYQKENKQAKYYSHNSQKLQERVIKTGRKVSFSPN